MKVLSKYFTHFKEKKIPITLNSYQKGSLLGLEELIHNMKYNQSSIKCASASGQILLIPNDLFFIVFLKRTYINLKL